MANASTVVIVVGIFALLFAMLYFASSTGNRTIVTSPQLQNAILIAESLNETKDFKKTWNRLGVGVTALYLDANRTEMFRQQSGQLFLPEETPTILVAYGVQIPPEDSAVLRVFIDPKTHLVYGTYEEITRFG